MIPNIMGKTTVFNYIVFIIILILCFIQTLNCSRGSRDCKKCKTKLRDGRRQTNYTTKVTFSGIIDAKGEPYDMSPTQGLEDAWKMIDPNVTSRSDVIKKGREFVAYVQQRFNIDISRLSDTELLMGSPVEFGNLTFAGYTTEADLRLVSKTTPTRQVKYYRNTKYKGVGYALLVNADVDLDGGEWTGMMPTHSTIYTENAIIDSNECDFKEEPHILITRPLDIHPAKYYNGEYVGANTWEAEVWSSIYGHGVQYSIDMHEVYVYAFVNVFGDAS
ncbi:unnamed protein product [Owenia fusiformis]|uniref:Uncharacterized protein n=1 Tax=Owenia fusiformis TaxID=6347 RepID=A0A8J1UYT9_OWEFU|nr:unnamed protein product [Owenia fusiformis]